MLFKIISATGGDDIEVVMSFRPTLVRFDAGAMEFVDRIVHLVYSEDCLQTTLVERFVMSH